MIFLKIAFLYLILNLFLEEKSYYHKKTHLNNLILASNRKKERKNRFESFD